MRCRKEKCHFAVEETEAQASWLVPGSHGVKKWSCPTCVQLPQRGDGPPRLPSCQACRLRPHRPLVRPQMLLGHKPAPGMRWCSGGHCALRPCLGTISRGAGHEANPTFPSKPPARRREGASLYSPGMLLCPVVYKK